MSFQELTQRRNPLVWIVAGESSGDLYGSHIAAELKKRCPDAVVRGMGGVKMKAAGVDIIVDSSELGVVGLVEVLQNILKFVRIMIYLVAEACRQRPDVVLLIDYPGFNIRFAKQLWKRNIPVIWYISPQVWVWRKSNIPRYAKYCRKLIVIFPFEVDVWKDTGLDTEFAGHPLMDVVAERLDKSLKRDPNRVLILPGSRKSEIYRLAEPFLETALELKKRHPDMKFSIVAPRERTRNELEMKIREFLKNHPETSSSWFDLSVGDTAYWMQVASAGLAASGTVTVESAISDLPLVVAYRLNPVTFLLGRIIIRKLFRGFFTMVNIILNRCAFEEFLQKDVNPSKMADAVERILPGGGRRDSVMADMADMRRELSCGTGNAAGNVAKIILEHIDKQNRRNDCLTE